MKTSPILLEARGLGRRSVAGHDWLVRAVSVSVFAGQRLVIVGPSGGGKTVLLRALALLDPLAEGEVLWRGNPIADDQVPAFRGSVVYLHQRPPLIEGTVIDNLRMPFSFHVHRDKRFAPEVVRDWLERLGRDDSFLDKSTRNVSGGEAQIIAILRAIQLEPDVLLLDEPTAALDAQTTAAVEKLIVQWHAERPAQRAIVLVTHDPKQAVRLGDRILHLEAGQLDTEP